MVTRDDVARAYRLILGRDPESEAAFAAHQAEPTIESLGRRLISSDEFRRRTAGRYSEMPAPKWVCVEIRHGLKLWIDLTDIGVSAGCLHDNWEPVTTDLILAVLKPGDCFVDVGANIGWFTVLAAHRAGESGRVFAFEPRPDCFERLSDSLRLSGLDGRCRLEAVALGDRDGRLNLASIPAEHNPGHSFLITGDMPEGAEAVVLTDVRTLDSYAIQERVRVIKIDVEGAELQVLRGGESLIRRDQPIILLEIFPKWLGVVGATTATTLLGWLTDRGYRVFCLTDRGIGHEIHAGNFSESNHPDFFGVIALAEADAALLLATRFDDRVVDLESVCSRTRQECDDALSRMTARLEEATQRAELLTNKLADAEAAGRQLADELKRSKAEASRRVAAADHARRAAEVRVRAAQAALRAQVGAPEADFRDGRAAEVKAAEYQSRIADLAARLNAFETSNVWKATWPLRWLAERMPRSMRRSLRRIAELVWWTVTLQIGRRMHRVSAAAAVGCAGAVSIGAAEPARRDARDNERVPVRPERVLWTADFVVAPRGGERGKPILPPPRQARALVIDSRWPRPDRDSGSIDAVMQVSFLQRLGYEVVFASDAEFAVASAYKERLAASGVVCLGPDSCGSIAEFLHTDGDSLDLIILSRVYCGGRYLENVNRHAPHARIVFNTVDLHFLREAREADLRGDTVAARYAARTRERELYLARQCDATIVVSAAERETLEQEVPGAHIVELPLARRVRRAGEVPGFPGRNGIGMVAGFEHTPNADAARFLVRDIWPLVAPRLRNPALSLVGVDLPEAIIAELPRTAVYRGPLNDLDPWLDGLRLTVAPLRFGAGAKGKVATSLAAGVPCVGTPIAAEGMRLQPGQEILVGSSAEEIAALVVRLHDDEALWQRLSENGRKRAERNFSVEAGQRMLGELLASIGAPTGLQP
jgi:FkbM family methyltransferase